MITMTEEFNFDQFHSIMHTMRSILIILPNDKKRKGVLCHNSGMTSKHAVSYPHKPVFGKLS